MKVGDVIIQAGTGNTVLLVKRWVRGDYEPYWYYIYLSSPKPIWLGLCDEAALLGWKDGVHGV